MVCLLYSCFVALIISRCIEGSQARLSSKKEVPINLLCYDAAVPIPPILIDKTFTRMEERSFLRQFYLETGGNNWYLQYGWSLSNASQMTSRSVDHCNWTGVICKEGYVIGLTLNMNNLTGTVPEFLWKFRNLMIICLPNNKLYGELKNFIFPNMTKLLRIDLARGHLSGSLPDDFFANLKSLVKVRLCCQKSSKLQGSIPKSIVELKHLRVLSLGENKFSGTIPRGIGKLNKVWFLDLEFMPRLYGNIKWFIGMTSLQQMHLSGAGIQGELPDDFGYHFPNMTELQLPQNGITGNIPTSINRMINLTKIILSGNTLSGKIPKELGHLPKLRILDLSNNDLQEMDSELSFKDIPNFEILLLGNNEQLTADLETFTTSLLLTGGQSSALRILNISNCNFYGNFDRSIWGLTSLIELDLKNNNIGGTIPEVQQDLMFLTHLDLSCNRFKGAVPNNFNRLLQSLVFFDIRSNSNMRAPSSEVNVSSGYIQDVMRVEQRLRQKNADFSCPFATLVSTNGTVFLDASYYDFKFCVCGEGFYGSAAKCKRCMRNGDCSGKPSKNNKEIFMRIKQNYWPSPSYVNTTHLAKCPSLRSDRAWACNPTGQCICRVNISSGATVCDKSCICHKGSTDRFCSKCLHDYYKSGSLCVKCPKDINISLYVLIPVLILLIVAIGIVFYCCNQNMKARFTAIVFELLIVIILWIVHVMPSWILEISFVTLFFYVAGIAQHTRGIMPIFVFYIQVLDAMTSANSSLYPNAIISLQHYMSSIVNLKFTGISCKFPWFFTPLGNYTFAFCFPLGCLFLIWLYYGLRVCFVRLTSFNQEQPQERDKLSKIRCSCQKASITCLGLTFFPVSKQTISILAPCQNDGNYFYMQDTPWIQCSDADPFYSILAALAWLGVIFYVIGIPVTFLVLLIWYYRNKDDFTPRNKSLCDSWLGGIYRPYKKSVRWYFEILKLLRKLLIAGFLAVFPHTSSIQTLTVSTVLILALIYQMAFNPYKVIGNQISFENILEVLSLAILQQSFVMLRFAAAEDVKVSNGLVLAVIVINIAVVGSFLFAVGYILIKSYYIKQQNYQERQPLLSRRQRTRSI